ncbi:MAG: large subunit ribosomal protein [Patescibacteria group bacterium]|nr:large subunit ribosomal protein [Patescibacteria group bacterium]
MTIAIKLSPVDMDARKKLDVKAGDTVRVYSKIQEKGKTRLQAFEGLVLARKHGTEAGATITVRKISEGVGVERIFPLYSPNVDKFEVIKRAKVKRSKLYFLREKTAKEIRRKLKAFGFIAKSDEMEIKAEDMENEVLPEAKEETVSEESK